MIRLHDYELSADAFKVRQLLAWLGLAYEKSLVDVHPGREHESARFRSELSPLGRVPVLEDDGLRLHDAEAILVYLAVRHDEARRWLPADAKAHGAVAQWLGIAHDLARSAGALRLHHAFGDAVDAEACRADALDLLRLLDDHLAEGASGGRRWLVADDRPTIADLACFPHAALAGEGGLALEAFPALRRWLWDLRHLPGFIGMPGILAAGEAQRI
jgi:glutathione S-transferase